MKRLQRWCQWARCRLIGWHTSADSWQLVHSEYTHKPLYWVYEDRCPYCSAPRPGSRTLYRWRPEHGTGVEPKQEGGIA